MEKVEDVEEGEILSDDNCDGGKKNGTKDDSPFGKYEMISRVSNTSASQFSQVRGGDIHYTSEEESGSESDDDSPQKKKPMKLKPKMGSHSKGHVRDTNWLKTKHQDLLKSKEKKPNNIWGSVLQEEAMSKFVSQLNRNEEVNYDERGAESYDWTRSKLDPRYIQKEDPDSGEDSVDSLSSDEKKDAPPDLTEIETFAAAVEKPKLSIKSRLGKKKEIGSDYSHDSDVDSEDSLKDDTITDARDKITGRRKSSDKDSGRPEQKLTGDARDIINLKKSGERGDFDARDVIKNKSKHGEDNQGKDRSKGKRNRRTDSDVRQVINERKRKHHEQKKRNPMSWKDRMDDIMDVDVKPMKIGVQVDDSMDTALLADTILDALQEPQDKLDLFIQVVEQLGAAKTIEVFKATEDIEEMGGLMINNGKRRRTPGGVFLWLIREDSKIPKDTIDAIFADTQKEYNEKCKIWKKERRRRAREKKRALQKQEKEMEALNQSNKNQKDPENDHANETEDTDDLDLEEPEISIDLA